MRTRQHADFGHDLADGLDVAAVDAFAGVEDIPAHDLGFKLLEDSGDLKLVVFRLETFREEVRHHLLLHRGNGVLAILLLDDRISRAQVVLGHSEDFLLERLVVWDNKFARLLGGLLGELDDRLDHRLEMPVTEHHGAQHDFFGQLLGLRFHHHNGVLRAGDDKIEIAFFHLVDRGIENVLAVAEADAGAADRAHERRAGQRQRRGRSDHGDDVRIVLLIVRQHGYGDLGVAAPAVGEQWANRAVDQARGQRVLFSRTALALEVTAGNSAGRIIFFGVIDGERKEIDSFLWLLGGHDGGEHSGLAVGGDDRAVSLTRDFSSL